MHHRNAYRPQPKKPNGPSVFLNDEVFGTVVRMDIVPAGEVNSGQPITSEDIQELRGVVLTRNLAGHPYIVVVQGRDQKFYVASRNTTRVLETGDFETLRAVISTEVLSCPKMRASLMYI